MATALITAVGDGLSAVITWIGDVITALTGTNGALAPLLPLLGISIAISALMLAFRTIRSVIWGN